MSLILCGWTQFALHGVTFYCSVCVCTGSRLGQWLTGQGGGVAVRVVGRFVRNLQEEVKRLRGPGHR